MRRCTTLLVVADIATDSPQPPAQPLGPRDSGQSVDASHRPVTAWDVLGMVVLLALMMVVQRISVELADTRLGRSRGIEILALASYVAATVGLVLLVLRDRPRPREILPRLVAIWRDPPGAWAAFALGVLMAVPILAFYYPILFVDSDSVRIVAAIRYVQDGGGLDYFTKTQEPYLPHVLLGPAIALNGLAGALVVTVVSLQVLSGVLAYIAYRVTRLMLAAAAASLALLSLDPVYERANALPMYPTALALACLGGLLSYRAMTSARLEWRWFVPAGVCLALAPEAHGTGQLAFALPALLLVLVPDRRRGLRRVAAVYGAMVVALIPRLVINLSDGGLTAVTSPRADYWITNGYLVEIQQKFWGYAGVTDSLPEFLRLLPGRFMHPLGAQGWLVVGLVLVACVVALRGRARWFVLAGFAFLLLAITVKRIPPFSRYFAPFWPPMALVASLVVAWLARHRLPVLRLTSVLVTVVLAGTACVSLHRQLTVTEGRRAQAEALPMRDFAAAIDDGKGVIGTRAHQYLVSVDGNIRTWGDQFLTEKEYVTFLTWPSYKQVKEVLDRHNIGWVLVDQHDPTRDLEGRYNDTWLVPAYGLKARHVRKLQNSPHFCRWLGPEQGFTLYRVGACGSS